MVETDLHGHTASEYTEWQPGDSPAKVRVHRRVLAGIEQEGVGEFRGVLLGSASAREILVEDFARLDPGPIEDWFASGERHSLPAVGYFRAGPAGSVRIAENDRQLFATHFPDALSVLLLIELRDGKAELSPVPAVARPSAERLRSAAPREVPAPGPVAAPKPVGPAPAERMPFRERPHVVPPAPQPPPRSRLRKLAPIATIAAGFLLGAVGYLALRRDRPQTLPAPPRASTSVSQPASREIGAARDATPDTSEARVPAASPPAAGPQPVEGSTGANRLTDPGTTGGTPSLPGESEDQIRAALARWSDSLAAGDFASHVNLYAPSVSPYFTRNRASRAQVRDNVRKTLKRYGKVTVCNISDVSITPVDAGNAFATFRKHWETNQFSGEDKEQLKLTRQGSKWLIAAERELKVYWVRKP